jgi:hypothetical protein
VRRRNLGVAATRGGRLFSLVASSAELSPGKEAALAAIVASFRLR